MGPARGRETIRATPSRCQTSPRPPWRDERSFAGTSLGPRPATVSPERNEVGKLWARFSAYWERHRGDFRHEVDPRVGWELDIATQDYAQTKAYCVMVGVDAFRIEDLPAPIFAKVLPGGTYAVFTLRGAQMTANWRDAIYQDWLPASDYEEALGCTLERYDQERFKGWGEADSEVEIWVPVRARQG